MRTQSLCLLVMTACSGSPANDGPRSVDEYFAQELGPLDAYLDCGSHYIPRSDCELLEPPPSFQVHLDCVLDAWNACEPAILRSCTPSIEGGCSIDLLAVVPREDGGCEMHHYLDRTTDPFGSGSLHRAVCDPFTREFEYWCALQLESCGDYELVFELEGGSD